MSLQKLRQRLAFFMLVFAILAVSATLPQPSRAQDVSGEDEFQLWNNCEAIRLIVSPLGHDATTMLLSRKEIEVAVRSRLRGARIYTTENHSDDATRLRPYFYVNVNVVGRVFNVSVRLVKQVFEPASNRGGYATTWWADSVGTHGRDKDFVLARIEQYADRFVDEYLRVNAEAC